MDETRTIGPEAPDAPPAPAEGAGADVAAPAPAPDAGGADLGGGAVAAADFVPVAEPQQRETTEFERMAAAVVDEMVDYLLPMLAAVAKAKPAEPASFEHEAIHRVNQALGRIPRAL